MVQHRGREMGGKDGAMNETSIQLSSKTDWSGKTARTFGARLEEGSWSTEAQVRSPAKRTVWGCLQE